MSNQLADTMTAIASGDYPRLAAHEAAKPEPACWTLTETLAAKETTCSARLWFVNPVNSAWTPLFTAPVAVASPLTKDQVCSLMTEAGIGHLKVSDAVKAVRVIEAHHGIKEKTNG